MNTKDRRTHPRLEGEFRVEVLNLGDDPQIPQWEAVVPATAFDVSRHGMRIRTAYDVPVGLPVSAILYYKGMESIALCEAVRKGSQNGQCVYGLFIKEWTRIDAALEKRLAEMENCLPSRSRL